MTKEIKRDTRDDLFAATPPLEAKKMLFSLAVTDVYGFIKNRSSGIKLDFIDIKRAYFHAKVKRELYIRCLDEDHEDGMCGKVKSIYGTGDAAQNRE